MRGLFPRQLNFDVVEPLTGANAAGVAGNLVTSGLLGVFMRVAELGR